MCFHIYAAHYYFPYIPASEIQDELSLGRLKNEE